MLGSVLIHVSVGSGAFGIFLQIVRSRIPNHTGGGDGMSHMLAERYTVASDLPCATVIGGQQILFGLPDSCSLLKQPVMVRVLDFDFVSLFSCANIHAAPSTTSNKPKSRELPFGLISLSSFKSN
jgi:hypothetical protein